jgi:GPH family glycoside/pentoside/hexuronide:cation symporter
MSLDASESRARGKAQSHSLVTLPQKINYGLAVLGPGALMVAQSTFLLIFYTTVVGLEGKLTGLALMIGRLWDAFADPMVGAWSDRTRHPMGRRRPYMLYGSIPLALAYIALWTPPVGWSQSALFLYLLIAYIAYNTFIAVVMIPYAALGAELSTEYDQRTSIMAFRMLFQMVSLLIGAASVTLNSKLVAAAQGTAGWMHRLLLFRDGYAAGSVIFAGLAAATLIWSVYSVREPANLASQSSMGPVRAFWQTLRNRAFVLLMLAFLLSAVFEAMGFSLFPYLMQFWYCRGDTVAAAERFPLFIGVIVLVSFPSLILWTGASRFLGKKNAFLTGIGLVAVVTFLNFLMITPEVPVLIWPWLIIFGIVITSPNLLVPAIIPDIVDEDELATRSRREGSFFGIQTFAMKCAGGLGAGVLGLVLDMIGFQEGAGAIQSDATIWWIRALYAFMRGGGYLLAFIVMLWFPLTPSRVAAIQAALEERRRTHLD